MARSSDWLRSAPLETDLAKPLKGWQIGLVPSKFAIICAPFAIEPRFKALFMRGFLVVDPFFLYFVLFRTVSRRLAPPTTRFAFACSTIGS
jgi:hypothetical protein